MNIADAVAALGPGALTEEALRRHIFPLFSKTLAAPGIYLANHSLGRPLDQTEDDLREGFAHWQTQLAGAWEPWQEEEQQHRARIAQLIHAPRPDCVIPKTSAGQGLRTILNALPGTPRVLSTTAEFDSVDVILKQYAAAGRISLETFSCHTADGGVDLSPLIEACQSTPHLQLVVVSQVLFATSHILPDLDRLAWYTHRANASLLVDAYHAIGVIPVDVAAMNADFAIGGSYKYLRGGPGAAFLYISPATLLSGLQPIDIGWFAKENAFAYERPNPPRFAPGGDAFLESTPPVLTYYQARAGQQLTLALGVERIRAYSLDRLSRLKCYLADAGIAAHGADRQHGAFLTVEHPEAPALAQSLEQQGIITDARGNYLRLCPDYLTTDNEMREAATALASVIVSARTAR
jgi:kynureninase